MEEPGLGALLQLRWGGAKSVNTSCVIPGSLNFILTIMGDPGGFKQGGSCHYDHSTEKEGRGKVGLEVIAGIQVRNVKVSARTVLGHETEERN